MQAARQRPGGRQQDERKRNLPGDQDLLSTNRGAAFGIAGRGPQRVNRAAAHGADPLSRRDDRRHARRHAEREQPGSRVQLQFAIQHDAERRRMDRQSPQKCRGDADAADGRRRRQQRNLEQQRSRQRGPAGSDGKSKRELSPPRHDAWQPQVDQVAADQQQKQQTAGAREREQPHGVRVASGPESRSGRRQHQQFAVSVRAGILGLQPFRLQVENQPRGVERHVSAQAADHLRRRERSVGQERSPARVPSVEHTERHEQIHRLVTVPVEQGAAKAGRGHAGDGERNAVDHQRLPHRVRTPAEAFPPEAVTDYDREAAVGTGGEQPPRGRRGPEHREVVT